MDQARRLAPLRQHTRDNVLLADMRLAYVLDLNTGLSRQRRGCLADAFAQRLGEVRGIEARTLLDSFNTGHSGSLATIHANSAEKALHRFANLVMRNHAQTTFSDTEAEIGESVDFVIHIERQPGGRVIREVLRMIGYDRDTKRFLIEPVFEVQHAAA